jgi:hypothetical protein
MDGAERVLARGALERAAGCPKCGKAEELPLPLDALTGALLASGFFFFLSAA